jgi:hypothetical protein
MATIDNIPSTEGVLDSLSKINGNFTNLNADKIESASVDTLTNKTINADNNTISNLEVDNIKASSKTGQDTKVVTGTNGTSQRLTKWDANGDLVESTILESNVTKNDDTDVSSNAWVLDEDNMASNSATKVPTQQSVKAYVDSSSAVGEFTSGIASKNTADASTTQTIAHGLGGTPLKVKIVNLFASGSAEGQSIGVYTSSGNHCVYNAERSGTGYEDNSSTYAVLLGNPNIGSPLTTNQTGVVSVDATNITITWTKNGSPTGTHNFMWEAEL